MKEHHTGVVGTVRARDGDTVLEPLPAVGRLPADGRGGPRTASRSPASGGSSSANFAPDYENPRDAGRDNVYNITVTATGGTGANAETAQQAITVTVTSTWTGRPRRRTCG